MSPQYKRHNHRTGCVLALILLLTLGLHLSAQARTEEEVLLYAQDFNNPPAQDWMLEPGWEILQVDGQSVLAGRGHQWARLESHTWENYRLRFRIMLEPGALLHANFRLSGVQRYFIGFSHTGSYLSKQTGPNDFQENLAVSPGLEPGWQQVEITGYASEIAVSVNGEVILSYLDLEPILSGGIAFESILNGQVLVDDVEIWGSASSIPVTEAAQPGELTWVRTGGPLGGLGYDVRMRPDDTSRMYVTDAWAGVHISTDGGSTWFPSNEGISTRKGDSLDSIPVFCLTIDPHDPDTIWIGTEHAARIFKSTDAGYHWVEMTSNIRDDFPDGLTFRGFTVHPETSEIVFTAAELHSWAQGRPERTGREFEMVEGIVFKTTDGGGTWTQVWRGDSLARYVWINPQNPDVMYISTGIFDREAANSDPESGLPGGEGVLKSTDGGQTWEHVNQGLDNLYVGSLYMHPENPDILLAGTGNNQYPEYGGVYITADGGETWQQTLDGETIEAVEFAESDPQIAYAGSANAVYRSIDGGHTWQQVSGMDWGPPGVRVGFPIDFQVDPHDPDRIFANAYGGGNFLSQDGGRTWMASSKGYTGAEARAIAVDPQDPAVVYAAARSGLFVSYNGGADWKGISYPPVKTMEWNALAVNPADPAQIVASNNWNSTLLFSSDAGKTWEPVGKNLEGARMGWSVVAFAPSDPSIVYAGSAGYYSAGAFSPTMPGTGVYHSSDGGRTWRPANSPLSQDANVSGLAVDPQDPNHVFAASLNNGLLFTSDAGVSWQQLENRLPAQGAHSVAVDPYNPQKLLAGFTRAGIYLSPDGGASWQPASSGMPPEATITSVVFDPAHPAVVYAADIHSGVYRSLDGGLRWEAITDGLRTRAVTAMAISADGEHLYAATQGEGVFRLDIYGQPPEPAAVLETEPLPPEEEHAAEATSAPAAAEPTSLEPASAAQTVSAATVPAGNEPQGTNNLCGGIFALPLGVISLLVLKKRMKDSRK